MENRIGVFRIGETAYRKAEVGGYLNLLTHAVFKDKFVVRCEFLSASRNFEYIAMDTSGDDFDEVSFGQEAPMYICNLIIVNSGEEDDGSDAKVFRVDLESWVKVD